MSLDPNISAQQTTKRHYNPSYYCKEKNVFILITPVQGTTKCVVSPHYITSKKFNISNIHLYLIASYHQLNQFSPSYYCIKPKFSFFPIVLMSEKSNLSLVPITLVQRNIQINF